MITHKKHSDKLSLINDDRWFDIFFNGFSWQGHGEDINFIYDDTFEAPQTSGTDSIRSSSTSQVMRTKI
ncbi:hypothetical protein [Saccharobesus litoralis]|nr:hypothetical protein [Saccharobesus litoralis]